MFFALVFLLSGANGSLLWSWSKSNFVGLRLAVESGKIAVVGQEKNGAIAVYLVQGKDVSYKHPNTPHVQPVFATMTNVYCDINQRFPFFYCAILG